MSLRVKARSAGVRELLPKDMTEAELQRAVVDLARSLGWGTTLSARKALVVQVDEIGIEAPPLDGLIYHPRYSLGSEPGWPDLTLVRERDRRLVFAELKAEKGRLSTRQAEVLRLLGCLTDQTLRDSMTVDTTGFGRPARSIEVHVWRPSDLVSGAVAEVLR